MTTAISFSRIQRTCWFQSHSICLSYARPRAECRLDGPENCAASESADLGCAKLRPFSCRERQIKANAGDLRLQNAVPPFWGEVQTISHPVYLAINHFQKHEPGECSIEIFSHSCARAERLPLSPALERGNAGPADPAPREVCRQAPSYLLWRLNPKSFPFALSPFARQPALG